MLLMVPRLASVDTQLAWIYDLDFRVRNRGRVAVYATRRCLLHYVPSIESPVASLHIPHLLRKTTRSGIAPSVPLDDRHRSLNTLLGMTL